MNVYELRERRLARDIQRSQKERSSSLWSAIGGILFAMILMATLMMHYKRPDVPTLSFYQNIAAVRWHNTLDTALGKPHLNQGKSPDQVQQKIQHELGNQFSITTSQTERLMKAVAEGGKFGGVITYYTAGSPKVHPAVSIIFESNDEEAYIVFSPDSRRIEEITEPLPRRGAFSMFF